MKPSIFERLDIVFARMYDKCQSDEEFYAENSRISEEEEVVYPQINLVTVLSGAKSYAYSDFTYTGTLSVNENDGSVNYTIYAPTLREHPEYVMNDFARFIGALWRFDEGESVVDIKYDGKTYTWDSEGTLKGSNWKNDDGTLVAAITEKAANNLSAGSTFEFSLNGGDKSFTVYFNIAS